MSSFAKDNSFEQILNRLLDKIPNDLDKRQGSIIYDALAPAAAEIAQCYIALDIFKDQTYLLNAVGINLDARVVDYGLKRVEATKAKRIITVYDENYALMAVDIGTRFSVPNAYGGYNFKIIENYEPGKYIAECETAGTVGNEYEGELLPLMSINNLGYATIDTVYTPGEDEETDEELRERALLKINQQAFSGNKTAYKQFTEEINGVGNCRVYPVWNGGGTVKVVIVTSNNGIPSSDFINQVQTAIDPVANHGQGVGIAPIGHTVTVVAPTKVDVNITGSISVAEGYTIEQLQSAIRANIEKYIKEVQNDWGNKDEVKVFISKLTAAMLEVPQVNNVSNLKINNSANDLALTLTSSTTQFPILNNITLTEAS